LFHLWLLALLMATGCAETKYAPKGKAACIANVICNVVAQSNVTSLPGTVAEFKK
jgi:hypothetical protein